MPAGTAVPVLLVSTYELGHQPFLVATAAAFLTAAGHRPRARDLSVESLGDDDIDWADVVAIAVPMHTATRLAAGVVARVRERRGTAVRVVLFGLYAPHGAASLGPGAVDAAIGGEFEAELVRAVAGEATRPIVLDRLHFPLPRRDLLPSPDRYARLLQDGAEAPAGYVEASRGCVHRCRHCPVPTVYDGRIRILQPEVVIEDAVRQWDAGVRHLTLGDPDALNAPPHTLAVLRGVHERRPAMTVDLTTKVEHILRHRTLWPELAALGVVMVTTAVESTDQTVLDILDKGHTAGDTVEAVRLLRALGIEPRPSFLPFTPWSSLRSYLDLLDLVARADLAPSVDPVQLAIRLLLPEGSLLLGHPATAAHLTGASDGGGHGWRHPDPAMDELAASVAALTAAAADGGEDPGATHRRIRAVAAAAAAAAGIDWDAALPPADAALVGPSPSHRPRLSESWFCCAEPTATQHGMAAGLRL